MHVRAMLEGFKHERRGTSDPRRPAQIEAQERVSRRSWREWSAREYRRSQSPDTQRWERSHVSVRRGACESSYEQDLLEPCGGTVFRARFPRAERSSISTLAARHPLAAVGKTAQAGCPR